MRRKILSWLVVGLVATFGLLAYAHTEDGFTRVVVPALNLFLPSPIEATRGRVSLLGHLEFDSARFVSPILGIDLGADRVVLDVDPISLFVGRFHVYKGEIDGLRYRSSTEQSDGEQGASELAEEADRITAEIPIEIDELRARSAVWSVGDGVRDQAVIGPLEIEVSQLRPGATGRLQLDGAVQFSPGGDQEWQGRIQAKVDLRQNEDGQPVRGTLEASTQFAPTGDPDGRPIGFDTLVDLTATDPETRDLKLRILARRDEEAVGQAEAATRWKVSESGEEAALRLISVDAEVRDLLMSTLNPFLDALGVSRMVTGDIDLVLAVAAEPDRSFDVDLVVDLDEISAQIADSDDSTPPVTLRFHHKGSWDAERERLGIDAMSLRVGPGNVVKIEAVLEKPVVIQRAAGGRDEIAQGETAAVFDSKVNDLHLVNLKQWLHAFRIDALDPLLGGVLGGHLTVEVADLGDNIRIRRAVKLSEFRFDLDGKRVGPLSLSGDLTATITDLTDLEIEHLNADLAGSSGVLMATQTAGSVALSGGKAELHTNVSAADLGRVFSTLGFRSPQTRESSGPLPLEASIQLVSEPRNDLLSVQTEGQLTFGSPKTGGERKLTIRNGWRRARGKALEFTIDATGAGGGGPDDRVTLQGEWVAAGEASREKLSVAADIERLDVMPYLRPFWPESAVPEEGRDEEKPSRIGTGASPPESASKAQTDQPGRGSDAPPMDLDLKLLVREFRFREVEIPSGQMTTKRSGGDLSVEVSPSQLLGGTVQADVTSRQGGDARRLSWSVMIDKVDIGKLARSIGIEERVEGILELDSAAEGAGANSEELRQNIAGHVTGELSQARFAGTPLFTYMAKVTGIRQFEDIVFDDVQADIAIGGDLARIRDMEASGLVAHVVFTGEATLEGEMEVNVNSRLGPSFYGDLGKIFGVGLLMKTASGFIALPIDVTVRGHYTDLRLGVEARVPGALDNLTGAVVDTGGRIGGSVFEGVGNTAKGVWSLLGSGD